MNHRWLLLGAVMLLLAGIEIVLVATADQWPPEVAGCYYEFVLYPDDWPCPTTPPWQSIRAFLMLLDGVPLAVLTLATAGYGVRRALRWFGR